MKPFGLNKQIILISVAPALLIGIVLSVYFIYVQLDFISQTHTHYGDVLIEQMEPVIEHAILYNEVGQLDTKLRNLKNNENVDYLRITDAGNHPLITINNQVKPGKERTFIHSLFGGDQIYEFEKPVLHNHKLPDGTTLVEQLATINLTLNAKRVMMDKIDQVIKISSISMIVLLLFTLFILQFSRNVIKPIQALTRSVRKISAGDLDSNIKLHSGGELGVLESCINHMKNELKKSQSDLEIQLNVYTDELQQTLEELEIRNAELDITRSKAIYANNAKSEFLANMSHEIRTPLSGIIGFTELLQGTQLTNQQRDYTSTIQKSSRTLLEIINDILDLSKIESGKTEISKSEFNLIDIIEDIINLLSPTALEKNIELLYRIDNDIPLVMHSDPFRIHQILTNLISNAIKFTEKGYVYIQVTQGEIKDAECSIKFSISDTGIGMNSEDKKKLFKAFTQADTSITRRFGGTGLGLVISRKLTLLMNGEIGFDSTEGEGSTFWFSIPITPVPSLLITTDLAEKRIAFFNNHFIARQSFKSFFSSRKCLVSEYGFDDFENIDAIEAEHDIVVVFLSRREIATQDNLDILKQQSFTLPSMLIASTRSHTRLRNLQQNTFDVAAFTSEQAERISQKMINAINKRESDSEPVTEKTGTGISHDWSNVKVMIVDDNEVNLRLAEIILHKHRTRVTTALSGSQAVDYSSMNSFDLIFMDLHMPGLDGYETTKKIREITPGKQPVIIALTANALPQEKEKVMQSGMNGILIKPVSDIILQKVINQWVLKESITTDEINQLNQDNKLTSTDAVTRAVADNDVFSLELAKEFTAGNEELAYELFSMLRNDLDSYRDNIKSAMSNNDLHELRQQAHKLHGASRCCGTTELKEASSHLEKLIDQKINFDLGKETGALLDAIKHVEDFDLKTERNKAVES